MSTWTVSPLHVRMLFIFDTLQSLLATFPSRLPLHTLHTHTRTRTRMHTHYLPDEQCLIRTLSFAPPPVFFTPLLFLRLLPFSYLSQPL